MPYKDYKVADISLADFGRREIEIAEHEMPGLQSCRREFGVDGGVLEGARVAGSLHMTVQTAVLIETLVAIGADVRWCSCNIFSTQDHAAAAIALDGLASVFAWKGETLQEYWECTASALVWPDDDGNGYGPDMIVDDGGDMTLIIHEGLKAEDAYNADKTLPKLEAIEQEEYRTLLKVIARDLPSDSLKWHRIASRCQGVTEETTTGVHRLYEMEKKGVLSFAAININSSVTKSKFDNFYGCQHSLIDGLYRATDTIISGKKVVICGYGDVGKGCAKAVRASGAIVYIVEIDPICALQAAMEGFHVVKMESIVAHGDIFITCTGNKGVITECHMSRMKHNVIVGNIGHFDHEIEIEKLMKVAKRVNIKPQVDRFIYPDGHGIIILAQGRLLNLGCATGHPSFVMSTSFTNQILAQVQLWTHRHSVKYKRGKVYTLSKLLDEKVARLHLKALDIELTELTEEQACYIGVDVCGPYKPDFYRY